MLLRVRICSTHVIVYGIVLLLIYGHTLERLFEEATRLQISIDAPKLSSYRDPFMSPCEFGFGAKIS